MSSNQANAMNAALIRQRSPLTTQNIVTRNKVQACGFTGLRKNDI